MACAGCMDEAIEYIPIALSNTVLRECVVNGGHKCYINVIRY